MAVLLIVTAAGMVLILNETIDFARQAGLSQAANDDSRQAIERFFSHPFFKVFIVVAPGGAQLFSVLLYGAFALLILALSGGGLEARPYGRIVTAGLWSKMVEIPHMVLLVPLTKMKGSPEIYFGPAAFFTGDVTDRWFRFVAGFDLFQIWSLLLFALGVRICLHVSTRRAAVAVILPWLVRQAIRLALG